MRQNKVDAVPTDLGMEWKQEKQNCDSKRYFPQLPLKTSCHSEISLERDCVGFLIFRKSKFVMYLCFSYFDRPTGLTTDNRPVWANPAAELQQFSE